jgi:hypothetical protein
MKKLKIIMGLYSFNELSTNIKKMFVSEYCNNMRDTIFINWNELAEKEAIKELSNSNRYLFLQIDPNDNYSFEQIDLEELDYSNQFIQIKIDKNNIIN